MYLELLPGIISKSLKIKTKIIQINSFWGFCFQIVYSKLFQKFNGLLVIIIFALSIYYKAYNT